MLAVRGQGPGQSQGQEQGSHLQVWAAAQGRMHCVYQRSQAHQLGMEAGQLLLSVRCLPGNLLVTLCKENASEKAEEGEGRRLTYTVGVWDCPFDEAAVYFQQHGAGEGTGGGKMFPLPHRTQSVQLQLPVSGGISQGSSSEDQNQLLEATLAVEPLRHRFIVLTSR